MTLGPPPPAQQPGPQGRSASRALRIAAGLAGLYLLFVLVRVAWLCDDAYITFRTVENAIAGHGLRWNVADRVQTYTHPLWMLLLLACRAVTGEVFYTALGLSAACTAAAVALFLRQARTAVLVAVILTVLACSRAFTTYATSGLENPLVFALLAAFAATFLRSSELARRLFWLSLWAGLLATARLDAAVLVAPALVAAAWPLRWRQALGPALLGFLPFICWLGFATFYYGTPWPSTAYAKAIAVDLPRLPLLREGLNYLGDIVTRDPTTAAAIAGSLLWCLSRTSRRRYLPLQAGIWLYLLYILWIGGDFMATRFAAAPFVLALFVLADALRPASGRALGAIAGGAALLSLSPGLPDAWRTAPIDSATTMNGSIIDERAFYVPRLGLWAPLNRPKPDSVHALYDFWGMKGRVFDVRGAVGEFGFLGGPRLHLIDPWLCDPLLMRLPIFDREHWRVGHYTRRVPEGYLETLTSGTNRIHHPALAAYYERLRLVTQGPLWSWERLSTAFELLLGRYDHLLRQYTADEYRNPPRLDVAAGELAATVQPPAHWFATPCRLVGEGGLRLRFAAPQRGRAITLDLDGGDGYSLLFRTGETVLYETVVKTGDKFYEGLRLHRIDLPEAAQGFDNLVVARAVDPVLDTERAGGEVIHAFQKSRPSHGITNDSVWAIAGARVE
ncbi:MAG: hypothetical protein FJ265_16500 [Planctomycetes bacterium]|nr:hypothetical protein [Planctomycetota bacterium]